LSAPGPRGAPLQPKGCALVVPSAARVALRHSQDETVIGQAPNKDWFPYPSGFIV